jgi:tetratricopeptide (TPR) repeat protein
MAIRGKLSEASLADVLQLLALGQKTGCLSLARDDSFGEIHFERGRIVHAAIVNRRDRLGDRLVRAGVVVPDTLARLLAAESPRDDRALAALLVSGGYVSRGDLEPHVRELVEEAAYQLFGWSHGTFTFEPFAGEELPISLLSISTDSLLLEGARRVDEWTVIAKKIPSLDMIFEADHVRATAASGTFTEEQRRIVPMLDGTSDLLAIVERSGLSEFHVGKAMFGLLTAGLVQRVGRSASRHQPPPENRVAEHRNLGIAFYKTGLLDEAEREFNRVLELRDEDMAARFHLGLVHLRRGDWLQAEVMLTRAAREPDARAGIFINLAYALERLGRFDEAEAMLQEAGRRTVVPEPRIGLSLATIALLRHDLATAEAQLHEARSASGDRQPTASWYHLAGITYALKGESDRAMAVLEEGLAVHPHAAVLHNNLAVVQERRGNFELAARTLEHALLEDANLPHLHKNLGDYYYRAQRYDDALEAYVRCVRLDSRHGCDVYLKVGNIHYRTGARAEAELCWRQALALDPTNAIVRANLEAIHAADVPPLPDTVETTDGTLTTQVA